jgi:hypothetical protein
LAYSSHRYKEHCVSDNTIKERCPLSFNLLYSMCPITPHKTGISSSVKSPHSAGTTSKENYGSVNNTKDITF